MAGLGMQRPLVSWRLASPAPAQQSLRGLQPHPRYQDETRGYLTSKSDSVTHSLAIPTDIFTGFIVN